jgi:fructose-1,6-bisphosphatase II / sedoheptulose-1,7-bisphosphatase
MKWPPTRLPLTPCARSSNRLPIDGTVVIGEGERDEAPMLYIGEEVGTREGAKVDIALDPLEGTTICAKNLPNSLAVIAIAEKGSLLYAPDVYMEKIAIGPGYPANTVALEASATDNINAVARAKGVSGSTR